MKNIYVAHSKDFDFKKELYEPLRKSRLNDLYNFILPHEKSDEPFKSKELLKSSCDLMIAEVSFTGTGMGIELGWADSYGVPILCVYKKGPKLSGSLKVVSKDFIEYENSEDLIRKLGIFLRKS